MSKKSNNQGRAYEYICLMSLYDAISKIRKAEVKENSSYEAALRAWNTLGESTKALYTLSAQSTIETILALEPNIVEVGEDVLSLYIQKDAKGEVADVRDIIIERKDIVWEIGFSIKHNHMAVKHSRLSRRLDFGKKWYGAKCSDNYWKAVKPIFDFLGEEKKKGTLFDELDDKENQVYVPLLNAFKDEIALRINEDPSIARKLVEYLLSKYDFYKLISVDSKKITIIQSYNMYGTLNLPSKASKPTIKVPRLNLPTQLLHVGFKPDSNNTILMCFDNGWQFSFRIHNAEKRVVPTLKFDVQIIGMPSEVNIKFCCKWN